MSYVYYLMYIVLNLVCLPIYALDKESISKQDERYMLIAIDLAKKNQKAPFAALIVHNETGKILAQGLNANKLNPIWHGEIVAINQASTIKPQINWTAVTLYTTAEPCPMCQSAIIWACIPRVVFGTSTHYLKRYHWNQINLTAREINYHAPYYKGILKGGVLANQTNLLFQR